MRKITPILMATMLLFMLFACASTHINSGDQIAFDDGFLHADELTEILSGSPIFAAEDVDISIDFANDKIAQGMTLQEVGMILGRYDYSLNNALYPCKLGWKLKDGRILYLNFYDENYHKFKQQLQEGTYRLASETSPESGYTINEMKKIVDFYRNSPVTKAWVQDGYTEIILFGDSPKS